MELQDDLARLSSAQRAALSHADTAARRSEVATHARVRSLLHSADCAFADYDKAMQCIRAHARVVVHFHPERQDCGRMPS